MFETNVTVVGRVITDIDRRTTATGVARTGFRVLAQERRFDRETQNWVDGDRVFVHVTCWRKLADGVAASLAKGDHVVVTGRLHVREYQTEDGQPRISVEVDARAVGPDLARCSAVVERLDGDLVRHATAAA